MSRMLCIDIGLKLWGSERALLATLPALASANEHFVLLAPEGAELVGAARKADVSVETGPLGSLNKSARWQRGAAGLRIIQLCLKHRINKIYLNQAGLCRIGHAIARLLRLPLVVHVRLLEDVARVAALKATKRSPVDLIFVSHDVATHFNEMGPQRTHVRALISYDVFDTSCPPPTIERRVNSFACLGRIEAGKGQLLVAEAFKSIVSAYPNATLDLIGTTSSHPEYAAAVMHEIAKSPTANRVRFLGYLDDAAERLFGYSFLVVASRYETLGRTVIEAWNAGCVPICSLRSGGAAEIVSRARGGILFDSREPAALAEAMREALAMDEQQVEQIVRNGRAFLAAHFSLNRYCRDLSTVLFHNDRPFREPDRLTDKVWL